MTYIFVFLGEFGVELLNWQGVVRKFGAMLPPGDRIICCSRANLYPLYAGADEYMNITAVDLFQQSRACGYSAFPIQNGVPNPVRLSAFEYRLKANISRVLLERLHREGKLGSNDRYRFIFSCDRQTINGCQFGRPKLRIRYALARAYRQLKRQFPDYGGQIDQIRTRLFDLIQPLETHNARREGDIYDLLPLSNNTYTRIEADLTLRPTLEQELGWSLNRPFILCQSRARDTIQVSKDRLQGEMMKRLIEALAQEVNVVLLSFSTGRWLDSYSTFTEIEGCYHYHARSFPEQACLIHFAQHCLFFSEGDLGSHTYVPPFMGKDVTLIAPRSVFGLVSAPIDFWNQNVFRFGGQMIPQAAEDVYPGPQRLASHAEAILER